MENILEILQALALVAKILKASLKIAGEVDRYVREHRHQKG